MQSPPFSLVAAQTIEAQPESLHRDYSADSGESRAAASDSAGNTIRTSEEAGLEVVKTFLREAGVNLVRLALTDGSGFRATT